MWSIRWYKNGLHYTQVLMYMLIITLFGKQRQKDCHRFEASLIYNIRVLGQPELFIETLFQKKIKKGGCVQKYVLPLLSSGISFLYTEAIDFVSFLAFRAIFVWPKPLYIIQLNLPSAVSLLQIACYSYVYPVWSLFPFLCTVQAPPKLVIFSKFCYS